MSEYDDMFCECIVDEDEAFCIKKSEDGTCPIIIRNNEKEKSYMEQMKKLEKTQRKEVTK